MNDWNEFVRATFIQVDNPEDLMAIQEGMDKYRILQNETQNECAITDFHFESLATLYKNSSEIREAIFSLVVVNAPPPKAVIGLL